jgi:hypothetical protein
VNITVNGAPLTHVSMAVIPGGSIPQVPPGVYRVLAFDRQQDEMEYRNAEAMSIYEDKGPVVRLAPGQTEQVRVALISTLP